MFLVRCWLCCFREFPEFISGTPSSLEDDLVVEGDNDSCISKVGFTSCITELADREEVCVVHVRKEMDLSSCFGESFDIDFCSVGGEHGLGIGTLNGNGFDGQLLVDDGAVEAKEMAGGSSIKDGWFGRSNGGGT